MISILFDYILCLKVINIKYLLQLCLDDITYKGAVITTESLDCLSARLVRRYTLAHTINALAGWFLVV